MSSHLDRLCEVWAEMDQQRERWGEQNHPNGTGPDMALNGANVVLLRDLVRLEVDTFAENGTLTYAQILFEECLEAFAESDAARVRAELIQVAAVAVSWIGAIDRRADS